MPPPRSLERPVWSAVCIAVLLGLAWLALAGLGWFGVGLLGLFVAFVAVRFELEGNRPVGSQTTPDLYASQFAERPAETPGRLFELMGQVSAARLAFGLGLLLTVVGFGFFFILENGR